MNKNRQESRLLAKNTFYSFFINYGTVLFQIISSMLVARMITKEFWGFLILANSYILIIVTISNFFPPALDYSINYYIPRYIELNQINKLRSFIKKSITIKFAIIIPFFIIIIFFFNFGFSFFSLNLKEYYFLLFILSPLIIIISVNTVYYSIIRSFNLFKSIFIVQLIQNIIFITSLLLSFFFLKQLDLFSLALLNVISNLVPFILNNIIIIIKCNKLERGKNDSNLSYKTFIKDTFKYGFPISFGFLIYGLWNQIQIQSVAFFSNIESVTGYNIALNFANYPELLIASFFFPLFISFSRYYVSQNIQKIKETYNFSLKLSLFLLPFISGLFFFLTDFILYLFYGEPYLAFSLLLKLMVIAPIFRIIYTPFEALLLAQKKVKFFPYLKLIRFFVYLFFYFFGLIYFELTGAILGIILSDFIIFILYIYLSFKILNVKLDLKSIFFQYIIFFLSLGLTLILDHFLLDSLNLRIVYCLNLLIFKNLPLLSIVAFIIIYLLFNILFRIFSHSDIIDIESIFNKKKKYNKLINKLFNLIKLLIIKKNDNKR